MPLPSWLGLLLTGVVLAASALLAASVERQPRLRSFLDGFVLVSVGGLCLLFLFPEALAALGVGALPWGGLGLALPWASERLLAGRREGTARGIMLAALAGLLLHQAVDGAALAATAPAHVHAPGEVHGHAHGGEAPLAVLLAIVTHQLPVGLLLGGALVPVFGRRVTAGAVLGLLLATGAGFALGSRLLEAVGGPAAAALEALLAGGLLHVVVDHAPEQAPTPAGARAAAIGATLAGGLLLVLPLHAEPAVAQAAATGWELLRAVSLPVLVGALLTGALGLVPAARLVPALTGRSALGSAARGAVLGLPLPICACGALPLHRELLRAGVPAAAAAGFLLAGPALPAEALLVTLALLGGELALLRALAALLLAVVAGALAGNAAAAAAGPPRLGGPGPGSALRRALRQGLVEGLDDLGPWLLAGVLAAALLEPLLGPERVAAVPPALQLALALAAALPLQVGAAAAAPIAAVLLWSGCSPAAALGFLLAASAANRTVWAALRAGHGHARAWAVLVPALAASAGAGLLAAWLVGDRVPARPAGPPGALDGAALAALGLLLLGALLRQGPRGFLARLGIGHAHRHGGPHEHDLAHEPACQTAACDAPPHDHGHEHHDHGHGHDHGQGADR